MNSFFAKMNTLRNQILFVFIIVMVIVLLIVSFLTFKTVSSLLQNNAEAQIQQVAVEASGRFDSLYEQINMVSKLVITNDNTQKILLRKFYDNPVSYNDRQKLKGIVYTLMGNADGISSFELYTNMLERILPLDDTPLSMRIPNEWVAKANEAKGQLVWIGEDPNDHNYFLAIRRTNLIDYYYTNGGYLLVSIDRSYFQFANQRLVNGTRPYSILLGEDNTPIISNYNGSLEEVLNSKESTVTLDNTDYIMTKQKSSETGWTVVILTPVSALMVGSNALKIGIVFSGLIGLGIFVICSVLLSTMITKPINRLTKTMQQASEGSLTMNPGFSAVSEINELNSTYNQLVKETNHLIKMVYQKEITRSHSELKALQAQINPHFLFNALDALHWSLEDNGQGELAEHVVAMSNLFRYTITKPSDDDWVFIKDEIQHIKDYMEIMKMRFGDRLNCHISLSPEWDYVRIPKLLIQPLVENAILHGAGNKIGDCTITVTVEPTRNEEFLRISVRDDGPGIEEQKLADIISSMEKGGVQSGFGKGMAISNVYKRLQLYYQEGERNLLTIESKINQGTLISFEIPIHGGRENVC
ncbi:sensor histidine kinase [Paenibacillus sp. M1]|uniref:histidine kinase n=1 Tax=Paenibacillus haidiansis TaxID=1574488 RepID=A0ABU7VU44_9BACL